MFNPLQSRKNQMHQHSKSRSIWWFFPFNGITLTNQTSIDSPLFGDVTLLSTDSLKSDVTDAYDGVFNKDSSPLMNEKAFQMFIGVLRKAEKVAPKSERGLSEFQITKCRQLLAQRDALNRAREVATLFGLIIMIEKHTRETCALTYDIPNDHLHVITLGRNPQSFRNNHARTAYFMVPSNGYPTSSKHLATLTQKPQFNALFRAIINYQDPQMRKVRDTLSRAMVRLGLAIHSADAGGQLLGAYTSLEILLHSKQDILTQRLMSLVSIRAINKITPKMITEARNDYVHRGTPVSDDFALASIDLAMYTIFVYARLADQFPKAAPTCGMLLEMLDARSNRKEAFADPDVLAFSLDDQMFYSYFKDLLPTAEEVQEENEAWSEFIKLNEEWSQQQQQHAEGD